MLICIDPRRARVFYYLPCAISSTFFVPHRPPGLKKLKCASCSSRFSTFARICSHPVNQSFASRQVQLPYRMSTIHLLYPPTVICVVAIYCRECVTLCESLVVLADPSVHTGGMGVVLEYKMVTRGMRKHEYNLCDFFCHNFIPLAWWVTLPFSTSRT